MPSNLHRVFRAKEIGFINKIKPSFEERDFLDKCRAKVRSYLKTGLSEFIRSFNSNSTIEPKFRVQGSWAYGTCNKPAQEGQEIDIDYGIYLPCSLFGEELPSNEVACKLFDTVEKLLEELSQNEKDWHVEKNKNTCVRISLPYNSHIDIPIYVVPNRMFYNFEENHNLVLESLQGNSSFKKNYHFAKEAFLSEESIIDLESITTIHMAERSGNWRSSDCELIRKWYAECLAEQKDNGRQLRYIARYLKAWRDMQWNKGGPSSILLMIIVNQNYQFEQDRDDIALLEVVKKLANSLNGDVYEDKIPNHSKENFNRMCQSERIEAVNKSKYLMDKLESSIKFNNSYNSINFLKSIFGKRISNDNSLIEPCNKYFQDAPLATPRTEIIRPVTGG